MLIMNTSSQLKTENGPPWEDWEDNGGFDDEESLIGKLSSNRLITFQERPWYYEKKRSITHQPIALGIQISFL